MAERRMFSCKITSSDAFKMMSLAAQALYFHLCMEADDDGFVNNPISITRSIGCSVDGLEELIAKRFVIRFTESLIVIKHWKINNWIRKDMYKKTAYQQYMDMLILKENGAYTEKNKPVDDKTQVSTDFTQSCDDSVTSSLQKRNIGKNRLDKVRLDITSLSKDSLVGGQQTDTPAKNKEETDLFGQKIELKSELEKIPYEKIGQYWNEKAKGKLPVLREINDKRKALIKQRWTEYGKDVFVAIDKIVASDSMVAWRKCGFDWCFQKSNMIKILEGNYDNNKRYGGTSGNKSFRPTDLNGQYDDLPPAEVIEV